MGGSLLARLYLDSERVPEAEELLDRLCASANTPEPWLVLSELRYWQGRPTEAADAIREAQLRGLRADQAEKRLDRVRSAAALATTRSGSASSPGQIGRQVRGMELLGKRQFLAAAECFAEAIQESPTDPENYRYLAACLKGLGRDGEAIEAWKLALHWQAQAAKATIR
jgi:tetratricopeptide (TPR) repeat protein